MRQSLLALSLLLATPAVFAQSQSNMSNFSYDYLEARVGFSPFTFGGAVSKSIHPNAHAIFELDSEFEDDYSFGAGLGFHAPINNYADVMGELVVRFADDDKHKYDNDAGVDFNIGLRQWMSPRIEVGGTVGYYTMNNKRDTDDVYGTVFGRFHATELFSLGLEAKINDFYGSQGMISTRFKF